jgi:Fic family protein
MRVPQTPPDYRKGLEEVANTPSQFVKLVLLSQEQDQALADYPHWDKLRHLEPPAGFTTDEWWFAIRMSRRQSARALSLVQVSGERFTYNLTDQMLRLTDEIGRLASGQIAIGEQVTNPASRDRYIVSSLIEEAITSSQLEGAVTTRKVAKDMLRQGRAPRDQSELMIVNNYAAMNRIVEIAHEPLTPERVREIHRIVVDGALEDPSAAGELQTPGQTRVSVWSTSTNEVVHQPPAAEELPARLERLCAFANGDNDQQYLPPLLRAIALHFMVGYDHYFVDGNGRTARALFYWSMLHEGFWLAEFLTVSRILHKAPAQYERSFLLTETDEIGRASCRERVS